MTDRTVSYSFRGNFTNLKAGLTAASRGVSDFGDKLTAADKKGAKLRANLGTVADAAGKIGFVAAAGLGAVIATTANFDKAMSAVQAATHESTANMELLRQAAVKAGADTAYSASEAAGAIEELAKAGVSTKDILGGGLSGALNLAAAGNMEVADAASAAATAMTQFHLAGSDVPHIADLLAAGAGKAQGEVSDLSAALNQSGLVASQMGLSIEETTAGLSAFASAGLLGSDAGTSFKSMLLALNPKSKQAGDLMNSLGFSAYDAQGNFVGLDEVAQRLQKSMQGLSAGQRQAAMQTIFGTDAIRAANVLYDQGAKGIDDWTKKVNDQGYAAETASTRLDNLSGDLEQLRGSLETAMIGAGEGAQGPLRKIVQTTTEAVNAFSALPAPAQNAATALLGVTAVAGGGLFFGVKVVEGITKMKVALAGLGIEADSTRAKLALVGTGAAVAAAAGGTFLHVMSTMDSLSRSKAAADATAKSYQDLADALGQSNVGKYASDLHIDLDRLSEDLVNNGKNGEYVKQVMDDLASSSHGTGAYLKSAYHNTLGNVTDVIPGVGDIGASADQSYDALKDLNAIMGNNTALLGSGAAATDDAAAATDGFASSTQVAAKQQQVLSAAMKKAQDSARETAQSFVGLGGSVNDSKVSLDGWIAKMREQNAALRNFRINAQNAAKKGLDDGLIASLQEAGPEGAMRMRQLANATKEEIGKANAAWRAGEAEMRKYVAFKVPAKDINVNSAAAQKNMNVLLAQLAELNGKHVTTYIDVVHRSFESKQSGIPQPGKPSADGGTVPKTSLGYADRHPYLLADGEEVISNRNGQADKWRPLLKAINANRLADGGTAGYFDRDRSRHMQSAPRWSSAGASSTVVVSPQSLKGLRIEGRVEVDGREGYMRGVIRDEIAAERRFDRDHRGVR